MDSTELIKCSACGELKPIDSFATNRRSKTGHLSICKTCQGARVKAGRKRVNSLPPPLLDSRNPKFEGLTPRQLIASLREIVSELKARGYSYKGELTYTQRIKL